MLEAFELAELRRTPMQKKFMQLCALIASRDLFADDPEREKGVLLGRARLTQDIDALNYRPR